MNPLILMVTLLLLNCIVCFAGNVGCESRKSQNNGNNPSKTSKNATVMVEKTRTKHNMNINYEKVLVQSLLKDYDTSVRPSKNSSIALNLTFGAALTQIIDVDERNQILTTNCWLNQMWVDDQLKWDPDQFGGVKVIRIPAERTWKPDVILYNNADSQYNQAIVSTNVIVKYNGNITWLSSAIFKSSCQINVEYFPFDEQNCTMKFASWTYDGWVLDLLINDEAGDLSNYVPNGEWDLITVQVKRSVVVYSCCDEPYPDITYTIVLRRRPLFYVFNLILPCVLISGLALLSFYMPSDSGEKVTLGITTLLSMTVFLMVIGESMPPTSEKLPLIGLYYGVTISLVSFATGLSVVTLSIHHRGMRGGRMPRYLRIFLFNYLAKILLLKLDIPKKRRVFLEEKDEDESNEPESLSCKIPLAELWRVVYPGLPSTPPASTKCHCNGDKSNAKTCRKKCRFHNRCISYCNLSYLDNSWQENHPSESFYHSLSCFPRPIVRGFQGFQSNMCRASLGRCLEAEDGPPITTSFSPPQFCSTEDRRRDKRESQIIEMMKRVLETMEKNERRMEEADKKDVIKLEWQQAALIVDRLLLWIFVVTTIGATFGILYMSPHTKLFSK